jgi:TP901 family phage tail tape measure protein
MVEVGRVTAMIDGDISGLQAKLSQAKSQAISSVSGIESELKGKFSTGISGALTGGDFGSAGKKIGGSLVSGITSSFGPLGEAVGEVATSLGPAGIVATAAVAGAVVIGSAASKAAMEWESGMSQISKTTGIQKGSTGFENLSGELKDLTSTMPTTVTEIQGVASAAGSLGIAQTSIAGFTKVALQMGSAFDIPAEQAAVSMGKIKSQLKSFPDEMNGSLGKVDDAKFAQHMGSAIDFVGNSLNATEADVLSFSTRTAGSFSTLGGSGYELAGWGGELSSVFSSSELAAGSFNAALSNLMGTTKGSANARGKAGELLGVSSDEFKDLMTNDPTETMLRLGSAMEGLGTADRFQAAGILGGGYGDDVFLKMIGHTKEWRSDIAATVEAGKKGESIGSSFAAGADTAENGFQVLKNSVGMILTDIGGPINSAISPVISAMVSGLNKVRAIGENLWGPLTAGLSPAIEGVSLLASGIGGLVSLQLDTLVAGAEAINTTFQVGKAFVSAFKEELTKIITSSSTFQTLSGYVTQVSGAFSSLGSTASGIFDKIVSGLSDAIPTAITGAAGAVGTLMDKAGLGGVADAAGGVKDFLGNVYDNAAEKLGLGVEKGTKDGMEKGSESAKNKIAEDLSDVAKKAAEAFAKENDDYIKSHSSGGYSNAILGFLATQQSNDAGAKYLYEAQLTKLAGTNLAGLQNFSVIQSKIKTDTGGWLQIIDDAGNKINSIQYVTDSQKDHLKEGLIEAIEPAFMDIPTYIQSVKSGISGTLASILSDGVVEFTEKNQLMDYVKSLDALQNKFPIEFEAQGLTKIRDDLVKTAAGVPLTLDMGKVEVDFEIWLQEHASIFEAQWKNTGVMPLREEQRTRQLWELNAEKNNPDALKYLGLIDKAILSDSGGVTSGLYVFTAALLNAAPEIAKSVWWTQETGSAQKELSEHVINVNGTFIALDEAGKPLPGVFVDTATAGKGLNGRLVALTTSVANAASGANTAATAFVGAAGKLSVSANQWAQSRISDSAKNNAFIGNYIPSNPNMFSGLNYVPSSTSSDFNGMLSGNMGFKKFANGGIVNSPTMAMFGEAGEEAMFLPLADRNAGLRMLPTVLSRLGIPSFASGGLTMSGSLSSWGGKPGAVSGTTYIGDGGGQDPNAAQWTDCVKGSCALQRETTRRITDDWNDAGSTLTTGITRSSFPQVSTGTTQNSPITGLSTNGYLLQYDPRTKTCAGLPFNAPNPSLKTTDPFYIAKGAQQLGSGSIEKPTALVTGLSKNGYVIKYDPRSGTCEGLPFLDPDPSLKTTDPFYLAKGAQELTAASQNLKESVTAIGSSKNIFGQTIGQLDTIRGASGSGGTPSGALVTGLTEQGYIATYDPRTDTCDLLSFNAPDPSLKTTDPFYLGMTKNNPAGVSWEQGGWAGQVATAATPKLAAQQLEAMQAIRTAQNEVVDLSEASNDQIAQLVNVSTQIKQQGGTPVIVNLGNGNYGVVNGSGNGSVAGSLISGGGAGYGTYSESGALNDSGAFGGRYGSAFGNDWYTGGVAGLQQHLGGGATDATAWMGAAAQKIGGSGAMVPVRTYSGSSNYGSGYDSGAYGGWVPSFADEGYISSPMLAKIGDRPGGEYVVGASRFEDAVSKMGQGVNITIHSPITIQGGGNAAEFEAMLEKRNQDLVEQITQAVRGL